MTRTTREQGTIDHVRTKEPLAPERVACARGQLAVARTLLEEVDRVLPPGTKAVDEHLADELRRLASLLLGIVRPFDEARVAAPPRFERLLLRSARNVSAALRLRQAGGGRP